MNAIPRKSYLKFRRDIPAQFRITKGSEKGNRVAEFREAVGEQVLRFKHEYMTITGHTDHRDGRWRAWLMDVPFDDDIRKIVEKINDSTVSGLKDKQSNIELYVAIYYRFHAVLEDMSFADAIDRLVFGNPLSEKGRSVFIRDTRPTAPFIHPPYVTEDYVRQRLENDPTDGIWLNPHNHHSIKLSGRQKEMAHLDVFMARKETFLICPVIAPSGAGKTRLISEWMKQYVPSVSATEWDAGFVISRDSTPWTKQEWTISRDTLIVIDYTFAYDEVVKQIAQRARTDGSGRKIRLIVIDHIFPKDLFNDTFWQNLYKTRSIMEGNHQELYPTLEIRPESIQSELLRDVVAAVASVGGREFDRNHAAIKSAVEVLHEMGHSLEGRKGHSNPDAVRHPLFAALLGHAVRLRRDFSHWNRRDLIDYYFSNEDRLPWKTWVKGGKRKKRRNDYGIAVGALVSAATLRRGLRLTLVEHLMPGNVEAIVQYASRIVSSETMETLKPLEPDILGEAFVLKYLQAIKNDPKAFMSFIEMLEMGGSDNERLQTAQNFLETCVRLSRNLYNDDQADPNVKEGWRTLSFFLNINHFKENSLLRDAAFVAIGDIHDYHEYLKSVPYPSIPPSYFFFFGDKKGLKRPALPKR